MQLFTGAKGRQLSSLECHDLVCKVAEIVVVGGVRRCAAATAAGLLQALPLLVSPAVLVCLVMAWCMVYGCAKPDRRCKLAQAR